MNRDKEMAADEAGMTVAILLIALAAAIALASGTHAPEHDKEHGLTVQFGQVEETLNSGRRVNERVMSLDDGETWAILGRDGQVAGSGYLHRKYHRHHSNFDVRITQEFQCYIVE